MFKSFPRFKAILFAAGLLAPATNLQASIAATATFTDTLSSPGNYSYNITLNDTGTTTIGTFWFSWVPGAGFMSAAPTGIGNPTGWTDALTNGNKSIQWKTTTNLMNPGDSLSGFTFNSTLAPSDLEAAFTGSGTGAGDPVATAFVYIAAPLADPGFQLVATPTQTSTTPEPGTVVLMLSSLVVAVGVAVRRARGRA